MDQKTYKDLLKEMRDEKNLDDIGELFLSIVTMYGLTTDEVAAMSYFLIEHTLKQQHNKRFISERFGIDVDSLGIEGIQSIQHALVGVYLDKVRNNEQA